MIHVVVVTWNRLDLSRACIERLLAFRDAAWRLTVVDNGSTDGTQDWLDDLRARGALDRLFLLPRNMGVAAAQNLGWAAEEADYYVKIDNDILVAHPDWLGALTRAASPGNHVAMAAYLLCSWHNPQTITLADGQSFWAGESCGGGCVCIPRAAHSELGFWNEDYTPYGYEDNEYGMRARLAGWHVGYVPLQGITTLDPKGDPVVSPYSEAKAQWVDTPRARQLWYINQFLFTQGLRPLRVERRSLPELSDPAAIRFRPNPAYRAVAAMHRAVAASPAFQAWLATRF